MGDILTFYKSFSRFAFVFILSSVSLFASSLSDQIQSAFDGAYVQSEGVMRFSSQTRGYYTFGHTRIRFEPPSVIRPFSAQAPSYNVGCNGIDIGLGGISYINADELVNKLKGMSGAASAFFFEAALSTLCKDCLTILNKLEDFANAINALNFDSCAAAKAVGTHFGNKFGEHLNSGLNSFEASRDILKLPDALETMDDVNKALAGVDLTKSFICLAINCEGLKYALVNRQGSLIRIAMASQAMKGVVPENTIAHEKFASIIRSLIGDLYGYTNTSSEKEKDRKTELLVVAPSSIAPETFINALMYGTGDCTDDPDSSKSYKNCITGIVYKPEYDYQSDKPAPKPNIGTDVWRDFIPNGGFIGLSQIKLNAIIDKIDKGSALSTDDQAFLGNLPYPIVKTINAHKAGIYNESDMQIIIAYIAVKLAVSTAQDLFDKIHRSIDDASSKWVKGKGDDDKVVEFQNRTATTARLVVRAFSQPVAELEKQMASVVEKAEQHEKIEKALRKQFFAGNYGGGFGF
ncbi:MAG: conjugal transfer protein TraH [Helicobacteraceae bacterium]|jgi:conjugative transfer pilus assembly protein TraH|nr:conjugal transfer protein TraH [Helicobacteraceae bacterium]